MFAFLRKASALTPADLLKRTSRSGYSVTKRLCKATFIGGKRTQSCRVKAAIYLSVVCALVSSLTFHSATLEAQRGAEDPLDFHLSQHLSLAQSVNAVTWNKDNSRLAALNNFGGTITIWETENWSVIKTFHRYGGSYAFNSFGYLSNGNLLLSSPIGRSPFPPYEGMDAFSFEIIDGETGKHLAYITNQVGKSYRKTADIFSISPKGTRVAGIPTGKAAFVDMFSTADWSVPLEVPLSSERSNGVRRARSLAFSTEETHLAIGRSSGYVEVYDIKTKSYPFTKCLFDTNFSPHALSFDPKGKFLSVGASEDYGSPDRRQRLEIISTDTWTSVKLDDKIEENIYDMSWSTSGILAVGSASSLTIISSDTKVFKRLRSRQQQGFYSVKFSSDDRLAAAVDSDIFVYVAGLRL